MKNYVELTGIRWDKENLSVAGKEHFTWDEALKAAEAVGDRLPTFEELESLQKLPHVWDTNKGIWFAETESNLRNPDKSLFLPAAGHRSVGDGPLRDRGAYGYYWSASSGKALSYGAVFNNSDMYVDFNSCSCGFSVRCVEKQ